MLIYSDATTLILSVRQHPGDDMQVSVGLLERHDPARGHVVVHPTPGARSQQAFAHDVLGALGQAVNRLDAEQLAGPAVAWRAVTAWMVTGQTGELAALGADRPPGGRLGPAARAGPGKPAPGCRRSATPRRSRPEPAAVLACTRRQYDERVHATGQRRDGLLVSF